MANWDGRGSCGPFDFTQAMAELCEDITSRHEAFLHIDMSEVAVSFAQARSRVRHGLQAKLTPMRFEDGNLTSRIKGRTWTVQRLYVGKREMKYILTFYLPRFLDNSFQEKFVTILHELFHISPNFNGDIRRFAGRCHVHTHSQNEYDGQMEVFAREYLSMNPPESLYSFLYCDFHELQKRFDGVVGMRIPIPKLIPADQAKRA